MTAYRFTLLLAVFCAPPARAAPAHITLPPLEPGGPSVGIEATQIDILVDRLVRATGSVEIVYGTDTLTAQRAEYDLTTQLITATGDVVLTRAGALPAGTLRAQEMTYNVRTRATSGARIRAAIPAAEPDVTYYVEGDSVTYTGTAVKPQEARLRSGLFTTCEGEHRHWAVRAREIVLRPGDRVVARGVSLALFGTRLLTLPRLTLRLGPRKTTMTPLPRLVIGRTDVIGLRSGFQQPVFEHGLADGYVVLSARHTVRAGLGIDHIAEAPVGIRAGFKEDASHRDVSGLTVTVIPAVTFFLPSEISPKGGLQLGTSEPPAFPQALKGHVVGGAWETGRNVRFLAAGSAGRYIEHPTEVIGNRLNLAAAVEARLGRAGKVAVTATGGAPGPRPTPPTGPRLEVTGALRGRAAFYSAGAHYNVATPELGLTWRYSPGGVARLGGQYHALSGSTPFFFDRVDARSSLTLGWSHRNARRALSAEFELDMQGGGIYAWEVSYSRRLHCIQPGLAVRQRGNDFSVGVLLEIPGVGG